MLTESQKKALCKLLGRALINIRTLGWENNPEQAADLADTLHNLPCDLFALEFNWESFKRDLKTYHKKYPPSARGAHDDFLTLAEQIETNTNLENIS